jgi:cystathionine gamma-synthase
MRDNGVDKKPVASDQIKIRAFTAKDRFFAVIFPLDKLSVLAGFWSTPGAGISSRFAEANLNHLDQLTEVAVSEDETSRSSFEGLAHQLLRERIIQYLERAALNPGFQPRPSTNDVYFYQTGMASIYKPHSYMLKSHQGTTVLFGMAFMNTMTVFEEFGSRFKFFGLGTDDDLRDLEVFLRDERDHGRKIQSIWAEFPANPILVTPNITRLRALADEYDAILAIDDTIGSWANIDVTSMTDMLVTSLTKSFNGYADVIAGSVVLNPASRKYRELKSLFNEYYVPELYIDDAETIERNSRDYLSRTTKLNHNASSLVQYLESCAKDPNSAIRQVHHPSVNPSGSYYKQFMRPATPDFTPGYGCLFSIEFEDLSTTAAFYDNLNVHDGPHLGAPFTLAFAYVMCAYKNRLDWAAKYGLKPTQIRISAGLEDTEMLLEEFRIAVEAANKVKSAGVM